jgi:hypothetical protein
MDALHRPDPSGHSGGGGVGGYGPAGGGTAGGLFGGAWPFLGAALAIEPFFRFIKRFSRHFGKVEKVVGVLLVLTGVAFLTGGMQTMSFWLLETFPALARLG